MKSLKMPPGCSPACLPPRACSPGSGQRLRRWAVAAACSACLGTGGLLPCGSLAAEAPAPSHTVQAPHYGDVLFHFFQDQYFSAVTGLMVSQQLERLQPHDDEAEVLRGGMLLSYGLHREAGEVFDRMIERGAEPPVRNRAWYFLAKIRYQRGLPEDAATALARIDGPLPATLADDHALLQAQVHMALGQYGPAAEALKTLAARPAEGRGEHYADNETERATRYARYNLGVALIRHGEREAGLKWLDELGQQPAGNEEMRALRDQANVALGYAALQGDEPEQARQWLERVRLNGPQSNKALLGFGWAALALKQPKLALVPWSELAGRDANDAAVLEAKLAVPHALAELGALGASLGQYEQTLAQYEQAGQQLDLSIAKLQDPRWLDTLLALNPGEEMGWLRQIARLPEMPQAGHLQLVMAQHRFQEAFKNHRDLQFLQRNLSEWQDKLGSYRDMLAHRRQAFAQRLPALHQQAGGVDLAPLRERREALARQLEQATAAADGLAFADERERRLLARVDQARDTLARAGHSPETDAQRERLRLLQGVLAWELDQAYPGRAWQARKGLQQADQALAGARDALGELVQAEASERERFGRLGGRLEQLQARIQQLTPQVNQLRGAQQQQLQALAVDALQAQKERLAGYALQARFAAAQLHDRALERSTEPTTEPSTEGRPDAKP